MKLNSLKTHAVETPIERQQGRTTSSPTMVPPSCGQIVKS